MTSKEARAVKRVSGLALARRRAIARDVIVLCRQISRAPLADGQMDNILKLHGLWCDLGQVEELLQRCAGVPPSEAGVWPSGSA